MNNFLIGFFNALGSASWLIISIILAGFIWLLYLYLKRNGYLFRKSPQHVAKVTILDDDVQTVEQYQRQVEQAVQAGKFRLAVRLLYLQTLQVLVAKEVVTYSREKTNAAYLRSMISTPWYKKFAALTLDYEYIWYGEVPVNIEQFNTIHSAFRQFINELGYTR
jgi:hypothetical protein